MLSRNVSCDPEGRTTLAGLGLASRVSSAPATVRLLFMAVAACSPTACGPVPVSSSPSPTTLRTPAPTAPAWLARFVYRYSEAREAYAKQLAAVRPPSPNTTAENMRYHGDRGAAHALAQLEFSKLRTPETAEFVVAAVDATQPALQVELTLGAAYQYRGGPPSADEQAMAVTLRADAERMWRALDDRIEVLMAPYGGPAFWPAGVRPTLPK
jgi:hypothetical protein